MLEDLIPLKVCVVWLAIFSFSGSFVVYDRHGEMQHGLNDQQFGSHKDWTAMDPVLLKKLSYDLSHKCRTNLATFDNDASSCYDRITVAVAMVVARRLRMSRNAAQTHAEALRLVRYYVKIVHGIS